MKPIIIISPYPLFDNYNYNYYITENGFGCVYFYSGELVSDGCVTHQSVNFWRA
jgi:hypothetical protein